MGEHLEVETPAVEGGDLGEAEFAGEDRPREAEPAQQLELRRRVRVELRTGVQFELGVALGHQVGEAQVGDDQSVEPGRVGSRQGVERGIELVVLELDVEGQMQARPEEVGALDRRREGAVGEVAGEGSGAPAFETRIDGVGAGRQGRLQGRRPPSRRQKLDARRHVAQSSTTFQSAVAVHADETRGRHDRDTLRSSSSMYRLMPTESLEM